MVNYSQEFIEKCKKIYPDEKGLHSALEHRAWIVQKTLPELFYKYKNTFINDLLNHDLTYEMLRTKIDELRIASNLGAESLEFES